VARDFHKEDFRDGTWEEFEEWIRETIAGGFRWRVRPQDNVFNREMIADLIRHTMNHNDGTFPEKNSFIERVE
jgi:hypothetical protein